MIAGSTVNLRGMSDPGKYLTSETFPYMKEESIVDVTERVHQDPEVLQILIKGQFHQHFSSLASVTVSHYPSNLF